MTATLSKSTVRTLWWLILTYFVANTAFLCVVADAYFTFLMPGSTLHTIAHSFFFSKAYGFLHDYHKIIAAGYAILALPFAWGACHMVWHSTRRRRLVFGRRQSAIPASVKNDHRSPWLFRRWQAVMYACGVHGPLFTHSMLVLESIEVALQTLQGFRASQSLNNVAVNHLYGIMVFINCWSTPVILFWWNKRGRHLLTGRLLFLVVDVLLAFAWGTIIQGLLYLRYWYFSKSMSWSSEVPETYERELARVLVLSWQNFVFSTFTFVTSGVAMYNIVSTLEAMVVNRRTIEVVPGPSVHLITDDGLVATSDATFVAVTARGWNLTRLHTITLVSFGVLVLITSIGAHGLLWPLQDSPIKCLDRLYPWFTTSVSCVGRQISCATLNLTGRRDELDATLASVSSYVLANLAIIDCPKLEMPAKIQEFWYLETLKVANSTVFAWDSTAAVTDPFFPHLLTLALHSVNFSIRPDGIMAQPLPASFEWMYAQRVNASTFLDHVGHNWDMTVYLYWRGCSADVVPSAVTHMRGLQTLVLTNNSLANMSDEVFADKPDLTYVNVAFNQLADLPDTLWQRFGQLLWLDIQGSAIVSVPAAAASEADARLKVFGFGTGMCAPVAPSFPWLSCGIHGGGW